MERETISLGPAEVVFVWASAQVDVTYLGIRSGLKDAVLEIKGAETLETIAEILLARAAQVRADEEVSREIAVLTAANQR